MNISEVIIPHDICFLRSFTLLSVFISRSAYKCLTTQKNQKVVFETMKVRLKTHSFC